LAAGMDACLSKPLRIADLKKALEAWLPIPICDLPTLEATEFGVATTPVIDPSVLASLVGNDPEVIAEFQNDFQLSAAKNANELRAACLAGNAQRVSEQAHKLTASAHAVGAGRLGDLCARMEAAGKSESTEIATNLLSQFESELQAVTDYFHALKSTCGYPGDKQNKRDSSCIYILILDDETFMHKLLTHMLSGLGYRSVRACENGSEALDLLDAPFDAPNLILLDLNMPGMDGIEFIRKLVDYQYKGSLILVSGEDERVLQMAEKLVRAHQITILGHLKKPVTLPGLSAAIGKWQPVKILHAIGKTYLAEELKTAIEKDLLLNYYQPKVSLRTGELVGVETLVRWRHPVDGLVLPDRFISLAEDNGLIDQLTRGVFIRAMEQARRWQKDGMKLSIAINVSMDNLMSPTFADFVAETAGAAGVMSHTIMLEVTESRLMTDHRIPLEVLTRLRIKRFGLSIDDFGTGHSSLTQLHDIPFNELKIDHRFVHGAWQDETLLAIFNASLGLGQQLGMEVVAEGAEDRADWDFLRRAGCDLAQGYFIGFPMPAEELPIWLAAWTARLKEFDYEKAG
ncbi:MAG: EAL domain-containing protein, partial [Arenimonas sp.]